MHQIDKMRTVYINRQDRPSRQPEGHDETRCFTAGYATGVPRHSAIHVFTEKSQHDQWLRDVIRIKLKSEQLSAARSVPGPRYHTARNLAARQKRRDIRDYGEWLEDVANFIERWGSEAVPLDVQEAVHDVQSNLSLPLTQFIGIGAEDNQE
jgi:hypothetical protein